MRAAIAAWMLAALLMCAPVSAQTPADDLGRALDSYLDERLAPLEQRLDEQQARLDAQQRRLEDHDVALTTLADRLSAVGDALAALAVRVAALEPQQPPPPVEGRPVPDGYRVVEGDACPDTPDLLRIEGESHVAYVRCPLHGVYIRNSDHIWVDMGGGQWGEGAVSVWDKFFVVSSNDVDLYGFQVDGSAKLHTNGNQVKTFADGDPQPERVHLEDFTVRNFRKVEGGHVDGIHVMTGKDGVIRGGRFENNEHFQILFTKFRGPTPSGWTVEDNDFGSLGPTGLYGLYLGGGHGEQFVDMLIQRNRSDHTIQMGTESGNTHVNTRVLNNRARISGCAREGVFCEGNEG